MIVTLESLPTEFRVDSDPNSMHLFWRGDSLGRLATGITCSMDRGDADQAIAKAIEAGAHGLSALIDKHTSSSRCSTLISLTVDLRLAQYFASRPNTTIYQVGLPANRLLYDPNRCGTPSKPVGTEVFAIDDITPAEIKCVKANNSDPSASELVYKLDGRSYIHTLWSYLNTSDPAPDPNPNGVWTSTR